MSGASGVTCLGKLENSGNHQVTENSGVVWSIVFS